MTSAGTFFGHKCPQCGLRITVHCVTIAGSMDGAEEPYCPDCNTIMEVDENGERCVANAYCSDCNIQIGLVTSDVCPFCGKAFSMKHY